jgi:NADPH2 dehydrogenase
MVSKLFQPLKVGNVELSNRIVMAPLTRYRADENHVPLPFVAEYYAQRASYPGTLLVTEATFIAPQAGGYSHVPGIWSKAQIEGWRKVADAVHKKGSFIYMQLWALGRASNEATLKAELGEDAKVVSASDIPFAGGATPTPLTEEEIQEYIGLYKQAAVNAVEAGLDGVEIHGANGYLVDQFLQDVSNKRTDSWGGSIEARSRFGLEVAKAVVGAVGAERTGIRMSPFSTFQGMRMTNPQPQFSYYTEQLKKLKLAYIHIVESRITGNADTEPTGKIDFLVDIWANTSPVFIAGGFRTDSAYGAVDEEYKGNDVAVVFGRLFIPNPDLVFRVKEKMELVPYDRTLFYNKTEVHGYTDYPFSKEFEEYAAKL